LNVKKEAKQEVKQEQSHNKVAGGWGPQVLGEEEFHSEQQWACNHLQKGQ
jgi:hypothetical protein